MRRKHSGFTLIEMIVVIFIVGILAVITISNYNSSQERARVNTVKSNARSVQMEVEAFAGEHDGRFPTPEEIQTLPLFIHAGGYTNYLENPYSGELESVKFLGYERGRIGYSLYDETNYLIEGYGGKPTSGPARNGVIIRLTN